MPRSSRSTSLGTSGSVEWTTLASYIAPVSSPMTAR